MISVRLYFDPYEKMMGDGFYPQMKSCDACTSVADISFKPVWIQKYGNNYIPHVFDEWREVDEFNKTELKPSVFVRVWKQMTDDSIKGLDGACGDELFKLLKAQTPGGFVGIVNLHGKFIYRMADKFGGADKFGEAEDLIRFHTAMPYILGGSVAKYQGMTETLSYLHREHPEACVLVGEERTKNIIQDTIDYHSD